MNNYGENPVGIQDKMTSIDLLRMAENLRAKVIIPVHYDIWSNFMASTNEILELWKMRKDRSQYDFHLFIWEVGGNYTYYLGSWWEVHLSSISTLSRIPSSTWFRRLF